MSARLQPPWATAGGLSPCCLPTIWWNAEAREAASGEAAPPPPGWRGLRLMNTFTKSKEPFVPLSGNRVGWYICGPTVYDSSHLGHARNYLSFDILRRVLTDYFGYDVLFVENVTDIDDKIILRTHKERASAVLAAGRAAEGRAPAITPAIAALAALVEADSKSITQLAEASAAVAAAATAALGAAGCTGDLAPLASAWDVQVEYLRLARHYEKEFYEDMAALGVQLPDVLTRVSEYVPQVISYIEKIAAQGYAYEANGSVYFDVAAFMAAGAFRYGKLKANPLDDVEAAMDGEGALAAEAGEKRSASDFVLWKRSKAGEPQWASPWGEGRPGWHIECSAMCSDVLGGAVDINGGGVDLAFPHHENQLAQSEAFYGTSQWVNFFLHTGHLHIEGRKMSKSLKNFITIRAALQRYSARQVRLLVLMQHWAEPMELRAIASPDGGAAGFQQFEPAVAADKTFQEYFFAVQALLRAKGGGGYEAAAGQGWGARERELAAALEACKSAVHEGLCDSVDTPAVIRALLAMVRACNGYMNAPAEAEAGPPRPVLVLSCARYLTRILKMLGLSAEADGVGLGSVGAPGGAGGGAGRQETLAPVLDALCGFRDSVRQLAKEKAAPGALLEACDALRDAALPPLGVKLDDKEGGAVWKLYEPAELRAEMAREAEARAQKEEAALAKKAEAQRKAAEKEAKARVPPAEMFRAGGLADWAGQFGAFDSEGVPTAMADGAPISKAMVKKLAKAREAQEKAFAAWSEGAVQAAAAAVADSSLREAS